MRLDEVVMGIDEVERALELAPVLGEAQGLPGQAAKRLAQGEVRSEERRVGKECRL